MRRSLVLGFTLAACTQDLGGAGEACGEAPACAAGLVCAAAVCRTPCNDGSECAGLSCVQGVCVACEGAGCEPLATLGTTCGGDADCLSGHCVDGVCCETTCAAQCFSCDPTGQCVEEVDGCAELLPLGAPCTLGEQCASEQCADGRCCDEACDGLCEACDSSGQCGVSPDDPACGVIDCDALDEPCRDFHDLSTDRCASRGACAAPNGIGCFAYTEASDQTACDDGFACTAPDMCDGAGTCAGSPRCTLVVDRGLVSRYFFDERTATDSAPATFEDRGPSPAHTLDGVYRSAMTTVDTGDGEGLAWASAGSDGGACHTVIDSKIVARLHGASRYTVEARVDVDASVSTTSGSRILHIGLGTRSDLALAVACSTDCSVVALLGDQVIATWDPPGALPAHLDAVLTLVVDTDASLQDDRAQLFVNGVAAPVLSAGSAPALGQTVDLATAVDMCVGNIWHGTAMTHAPRGNIRYLALYDEALTSDEVQANAEAILTADDTSF